jgi:hypothetical protein
MRRHRQNGTATRDTTRKHGGGEWRRRGADSSGSPRRHRLVRVVQAAAAAAARVARVAKATRSYDRSRVLLPASHERERHPSVGLTQHLHVDVRARRL